MIKPSIHARLTLSVLVLTIVVGTVPVHAQIFSVLYNFGTKSTDPANPDYPGILAQGRDGNLYGTTPSGTVNGYYGGVFQLTPSGTLTVKYSFSGFSDGGTPYGGLTLGTDGNFYGTTYGGGTAGYGTVFKITPAGTLTTLYSFTDGTDGSEPYAPPVQGTDGNFYGTTSQFTTGRGTIYKITPTGTLTSLYQFDNTHGVTPLSPMLLGTDGNFYGTTANGGSSGYGVVFRITPAGKLAVLHNFDGTHGRGPAAPLVQGSDGNLYGAAVYGGAAASGVVFKMTPTGAFTVLHNMNGTTDGSATYGLGQATDGNFYGVNSSGGTVTTGCPTACGTLFKITPAGVFSLLHNFDGPTGINPAGSPFQLTNGLVYGDARFGGTGTLGTCTTGACGTVFSWNQSLASFVRAVTYSGKVGNVIEFLGQGFTGTTAVSFNGKPAAFAVGSATYMTATVPSGATTGSVTVTTPSGTLTSNKKFRVTPQITSFSPTSGPVTTVVTIMGASLTQTTAVTFGGVKATTFTANSDTQVSATVPSGAKTGKITVTTAGGSATSSSSFSVTPTISSFSPSSGKVGTVVTVTGTGLIQTTKVTFGGVAATTFTVKSDTQVTATVPTGAVTGRIAITTPGGTASSSGTFTVTPAITGFNPTSGPVGTSVTIIGIGFTGATSVKFNGVSATLFTVNSDTKVTAIVPTGATTGPISITTPHGTAKSGTNFTVT